MPVLFPSLALSVSCAKTMWGMNLMSNSAFWVDEGWVDRQVGRWINACMVLEPAPF